MNSYNILNRQYIELSILLFSNSISCNTGFIIRKLFAFLYSTSQTIDIIIPILYNYELTITLQTGINKEPLIVI
jgi:hypothetical protein